MKACVRDSLLGAGLSVKAACKVPVLHTQPDPWAGGKWGFQKPPKSASQWLWAQLGQEPRGYAKSLGLDKVFPPFLEKTRQEKCPVSSWELGGQDDQGVIPPHVSRALEHFFANRPTTHQAGVQQGRRVPVPCLKPCDGGSRLL